MTARRRHKRFGVIGGLGALAGADLLWKLVKAAPAHTAGEHFDISFEQHAFDEDNAAADASYNPTARKLYVFSTLKALEQRNIDAVMLGCFISHTFMDELTSDIRIPVVNMMTGLTTHVQRQYPQVQRLGILTSSYVRERRLFEAYFDESSYELIYPTNVVQKDCLMEAVYGRQGIKAGHLTGKSIEMIQRAFAGDRPMTQ